MAALPKQLTGAQPNMPGSALSLTRSRSHRRHPLAAAIGALAAVALVAGGATPSARQRADSAGGTPGTREPQRIVSFVPAVTELLFAIGAGQHVVGVSAYDRFPPAVRELPNIGGLLDPNVERTLALRPDLVVVYATQRELQQRLNGAGISIYEYVHRDLADVPRTARALGRRVGRPEAADHVARSIEDGLETIRRRSAGRARPSTLLVFGRDRGALRRIHASGGYGFLHDLLEVAGGRDVMSDIRRESVEMSVEGVLTRAPEVIIEIRYGQTLSLQDIERIKHDWDALPAVPAVRRRQVHVLQGDEFVVPGPRVVAAAAAINSALLTLVEH